MVTRKGVSAVGVAVLAFVVGSVRPAHASSVVINGSFETGNFTGWTPVGDQTFNGVQCPGPGPSTFQGNCSAFFGAVGTTGGIRQDLTTQVGEAVLITFALSTDGGVTSSFSASFGGTTLISLTNPAASPFHLFSFIGTATGTTSTLQFNFRDDPGFIFLDAVSVTQAPEPATLLLVGTGIALARARRRRV